MKRSKDILKNLTLKLSLTRRTFVTATLALASSSTLFAKTKDDTPAINSSKTSVNGKEYDKSKVQTYDACCVHNCGTGERCLSKIHVKDGKVIHVTSDESDTDFDGNIRDKNQYNDSRALTCTKGRAYRYRLYQSGRLKYPLKQTKKRGDVTGFVRVTTEQAMEEVVKKYRATYSKYGPAAIFDITASAVGYGGTFSNPKAAKQAILEFTGGIQKKYASYSFHQYDYAGHLTGLQGALRPVRNLGLALPHIAGVVKNTVSWGTNILSSNNSVAWSYARSIEMMKERNPNSKVYFIGPEFTDTGVTIATDWIQLRNYTDTALIMAMFYEMIVNTFNKNGTVKKNPYLDIDYLDTMVYGFFDSPEYWIDEKTGEISLTNNGGKKIDAVAPGKSLSAYVMGDDDRLTKAKYSNSNYTSSKFNDVQKYRNLSICSYNSKAGNSTKYRYKKDFLTPKTPKWAEKICGTPVESIKKLAKMYCDPNEHPIFNEWSGGVQKQDNGVINLYAITSLLCVTKTFGLNGEGFFGSWGSHVVQENTGDIGSSKDYLDATKAIPKERLPLYKENKKTPIISSKEWFNTMKIAYFDELKKGGYTGKHIPDWNMKERWAFDDGGAKATVLYKYDNKGNILTYKDSNDGLEYYDYVGRDKGADPIYVGTRMIISYGGAILINQHMNSNDNAEMCRSLPLATKNPNDPDTFCFVDFDIYMSPTARYADYLFPSTVALEAGDWTKIGGEVLYRPPVSKAPNETKDGWTYAYEAYKAHSKLGAFNGVDTKDAHLKYVGTINTTKKYQSAEVLSFKVVDDALNDKSSRFYGMSREEFFEQQYRPRKNTPAIVTSPNNIYHQSTLKTDLGGLMREALDKHMSNNKNLKTKPFIKDIGNSKNIITRVNAKVHPEYGQGKDNIANIQSNRPNFSGKFHVYHGAMVWDYENRYSKWHGYLPKEKRGQSNIDYEGDSVVYPIPMYFNFEDSFNESYGVFNGKEMNDLSKGTGKNKPLTLSTTHDKFRVHSTHNENPLLRELNHRVIGGGFGSGNDWKEYCIVPENHKLGKTAEIAPMISEAILNKRPTASWHEIWINDKDAKDRDIKEGDLVKVSNPIGTVRAIARVSTRCMRGHANLHQGGWYDPNPADGVDDGGNANTLMASKGSRIDHGNAQQSAYVVIQKEINF